MWDTTWGGGARRRGGYRGYGYGYGSGYGYDGYDAYGCGPIYTYAGYIIGEGGAEQDAAVEQVEAAGHAYAGVADKPGSADAGARAGAGGRAHDAGEDETSDVDEVRRPREPDALSVPRRAMTWAASEGVRARGQKDMLTLSPFKMKMLLDAAAKHVE